jgi:putative ABC transport system ATP-binding protein
MGRVVHVESLRHAYGDLVVLDDLGLDIEAGEHVALVGPSGSGKSTLLGLLGGLEPVQEGSVVVGGVELRGLSGRALAEHRRATVGFVFQHFGLLDTLTAAENVALACTLAGAGRGAGRRRAADLLAAVGLTERAGHRPPHLSGGERQRVALARALANRPRLILADEPTGNLDTDSARRVVDLLAALPADTGCTVVVVTHDPEVAGRADRRLGFADGRLVPLEAGRPTDPTTVS